MGEERPPVYFADENALGLAKLVRRSGREDMLYPGHEDLPEVPLGSPDLTWMPLVAERRLIVVTRERRIRTRPIELAAYREHGVRSVRIGGKHDLGAQDQLDLFLLHERRIRRAAIRLGSGPWALLLTREGVRELRSRSFD